MNLIEKKSELPTGLVHWRVGGAGPPLLYLHGIGGARLSPPLLALTATYRVCAPILPGFDGTAMHDVVASMPALADLIAAFAAMEIAEACDVIGHSFGGLLAMWLALRHPAQIARLVLGCPAGIIAGDPPRGAGPEALRQRLYAHPERLSPEARSPVSIHANQAAGGHYYARGLMAEQLVANLETITCPTLILAGARDGIVPREVGDLLKARLPHSQLAVIADAAHSIETDQPALYERVVGNFLADRRLEIPVSSELGC